jgi:hypothetical protein
VLKENLLWVRRFDTVEELRGALLAFQSLFYRVGPISVVTNDGGARCGPRKTVSVTRTMADATRAT